MNKKIIISLGVIGLAAAIAIGATTAFFSDTETSTGNTFTAGAIDLKIDNTSYVTDENGVLVYSDGTSWELDDLDGYLFFDFADLKPGDIGEDTISLHVNNNDAWACMSVDLTGTPENDQTEPEDEIDQTDGDQEGELQDELYFAFWADDGDNVYEVEEVIFAEGLAADLFDGENWALADFSRNVWVGQGPIQGGEDDLPIYYIGKVWCYGNLTPEPVAIGEGNPIARGTGFVCDGASVTNVSQTDGIVADVEFYAVQSRNNTEFTCDSLNVPDVCDYTVVETGSPIPGLYDSTITPVTVTNEDCSVVTALRSEKSQNFSADGWAGWSCVETGYPHVIGGGGLPNNDGVFAQGPAEYGALAIDGFNYPVYPHYTYNGGSNTPDGEEGWVVRAGSPLTIGIYVLCAN